MVPFPTSMRDATVGDAAITSLVLAIDGLVYVIVDLAVDALVELSRCSFSLGKSCRATALGLREPGEGWAGPVPEDMVVGRVEDRLLAEVVVSAAMAGFQ